MMDNAGLAAGPQIIVDSSLVEPLDGKWEMGPLKVWVARKNAQGVKVGDAIKIVVIPMLLNDLLSLINFWLLRADEVTGLPQLLRGQQGNVNETLGGMTMLQNNGTSVMRRIVHAFDDRITEPHIARYYEWLMMHGPDDAKGDMQIDARGSSALFERNTESQFMGELLQVSVNPAYMIDPALLATEFLKSKGFDPKRIALSQEKMAKMAPQAPPPDPRLQVAQIVSQDKDKVMTADSNKQKLQLAFEADQAERQRQHELLMTQFDDESDKVGMGVDRQNVTDDLKAKIAIETMKLQLQKELSEKAAMMKSATPGVTTPPNEPAGQAAPGEAFQS